MAVRIRRTPDQYVWSSLDFDVQLLTKHFTPLKSRKIRYVVVHHMTILGDGKGRALDACYATWQTREASAHYGVDGRLIRQYVWDKDRAWATGNATGNQDGISIEHANSTAAPSWKVSDDTIRTGARLVAQIHVNYKLGRPVLGKTLRLHSSFTSTACPGPYLGGSHLSAYVRLAQEFYDQIKAGTPITTPTTPPPVVTPPKPSTDRMDPAAYFLGANGPHVTWLEQRLVAHLTALGITPKLTREPGPSFTAMTQVTVKQFQNAQGWSGDDADGLPGPETLRRLAADPAKRTTVPVRLMHVPLAGYNAANRPGVTRWRKNTDGAAAIIKRRDPDLVFCTELSNRLINRMLPRLTKALEPGLLRINGGSDGRWMFRDPKTTRWVASRLFTTPNTRKLRLRGDDKQGFATVFDKDGARGLFAGFHAENEDASGATQVNQAMWFADRVEAFAKSENVPTKNVVIVGDFNSESLVAAAFRGRGYTVIATADHVGWDGLDDKPFNLAVTKGGKGRGDDIDSGGNSDHDWIFIDFELTK